MKSPTRAGPTVAIAWHAPIHRRRASPADVPGDTTSSVITVSSKYSSLIVPTSSHALLLAHCVKFRHEGVKDYQSCETKCLAASSDDCVAYQWFDNETCMFMTLCTGPPAQSVLCVQEMILELRMYKDTCYSWALQSWRCSRAQDCSCGFCMCVCCGAVVLVVYL